MGKFIDLTGQNFGKWTVLEKTDERDASGAVMWKCKCECGTIRNVSGSSLRKGKSTCCGCIKPSQRLDITGQRFDRLVAIEVCEEQSTPENTKWLCKCDCGYICVRALSNLRRKDEFHSCGCYNKEFISQLKAKDLTGQRFGKLVVLKKTDARNNRKGIVWKCRCDCGNIHYTDTNCLTSGNTQSCGCINYSIGENNIANVLTQNNIEFIKEFKEPTLNMKRFDFAIVEDGKVSRLVEFDGEQHFMNRKGVWNSTETLETIQARDKEKNEWAAQRHIPLVRIPYTQRDNITLEMIMGDDYLV